VTRADALRSLGRFKEAAESLRAAETLDQRLNGNKPLLASVNFSRAEMDLSRLSFAEMEQDLHKMMDAAGPGPLEASEKRLRALQLLATGRSRKGLELSEQSLQQAKTIGNISLLRNSELALAQAKLATGDAAGALALASGLAKSFGGKGQHESELRALAVSISASRGADRARYFENARASLAALRQEMGESFSGFASRPDIRQIIQRAELASGIN
jgi:hypothetical protein